MDFLDKGGVRVWIVKMVIGIISVLISIVYIKSGPKIGIPLGLGIYFLFIVIPGLSGLIFMSISKIVFKKQFKNYLFGGLMVSIFVLIYIIYLSLMGLAGMIH